MRMITQNEFAILRRASRRIDIKIELINSNDVVIDSFEGISTNGNISLDVNSAYRRSGSITMVLNDPHLAPGPDSKIWFNKRIGIHIGLRDFDDQIIWFPLGRFAVDEVDLQFSPSEKTISCQLKDYMAFVDGNLGGVLTNPTVHKANEATLTEVVRTALSVLAKVSVDEIILDEIELVLPYEIEKPPGTTIYEVIKEVLDLYMGYQFYVNTDGFYVVDYVGDGKNLPVIETFNEDVRDVTLSSSVKTVFSNVKNSISMWGKLKETGEQIFWRYRNRWAVADINERNDLLDRKIGDICHVKDTNQSYSWEEDGWKKLSFNVVPEFSMQNIGEITEVDSDDKVSSVEQAKLRAEYALQHSSNMAETIQFQIVPLYYLQPNQKIHVDIEGVAKGDYLIQTMSIPLDVSTPMSITATKIYY